MYKNSPSKSKELPWFIQVLGILLFLWVLYMYIHAGDNELRSKGWTEEQIEKYHQDYQSGSENYRQ